MKDKDIRKLGDIGKYDKWQKSKIPHRCPICGGNGIVPSGFYMQTTGMWGSTDVSVESCRSCGGSGIVWEV